MRLTKKQLVLIIYLAMLSAFAPFSTDIYLASMPVIQGLFRTSAASIQLTLSLFFVSFALMMLAWGPLSDRVGRKRVIFIGVGIFILGSLACALSQNITQLIAARIVQALGASSGTIVALAIVKDIFDQPERITRVLSILISVIMLAPMVAPIVGSYLLVNLGWRSNFYFLLGYGLLLLIGACFIAESYPVSQRKPLPINKLLSAYVDQVSEVPFALIILAGGANFSVMFAFIASSPFIYINIYHLATHLFGYFFAINAFAITCGSISLNKLKDSVSNKAIVIFALVAMWLGGITMLGAIHLWPHSIWSIVATSFLVTYGVGILFPELATYALNHVKAYTGLASSLIGAARFIAASIIGVVMGFVVTQSALPLAIVMLTLMAITSLALVFYFKFA